MESATSAQSQDGQSVTAIISHRVRSGREPGYEDWIHGISAAAKAFEGHQGVNVLRPSEHTQPEYVVVLRFDRYEHLKQWLESDTRQSWIQRLKPLIAKPENIQTLTGLETWFSLPRSSRKAPPPRHKMALVTWLGVFSTLAMLSRLLAPLLSRLPLLINQWVTTGLVVFTLTYWVMPQLTKLFRKWLYSEQ